MVAITDKARMKPSQAYFYERTTKIEIPSLTGLRFIAALSVVLSHAVILIFRPTQDLPFASFLTSTSGFGMSLFFVLSGFVIHYNYSTSVRSFSPTPIINFFVARFARLYPLYFLLLAAELCLGRPLRAALNGSDPVAIEAFSSLPYYLTLTQSWVYLVFGSNSLVYQIGDYLSVTWSVSTEWFFYCTYPFIAVALLRHFSISRSLILAFLVSVVVFAVTTYVYLIPNPIVAKAVSIFGSIADPQVSTQDNIVRWLMYFSPYSRVAEFIVGCISADIFMRLQRRPVTIGEKIGGLVLLNAALAALVFIHCVIYTSLGDSLAVTFSGRKIAPGIVAQYAPAIAVLLFCCARYVTWFSRLMSHRIMVACGDASYSLYLLHIIVAEAAAVQGSVEMTDSNMFLLSLRVLAVIAICVVISIALYRGFEMPARRWVRGLLSISEPVTAQKRRVLLAGIAVPFLTLAILHIPAWLPHEERAAGLINVISGTYGASCVPVFGNATRSVADACGGHQSCRYVVDVNRLGDPAQGCGKDFKVEWRCASRGPINQTVIPGEAGLGKEVELSCAAGKS